VTSLVFIAGPNTGRRYELTEGEYVIGRRSDCQVFVPDMRVSRQHARLRQNAGRWEIEDLGSNNGTWVNGARIAAPQPVRAGDEVTIASNRIRVEGAADDAEHHHSSGDARLTIVEAAGPVVRSREDSGAHPLVRVTTPLSASTELRNLRLLERKLTALTAILAAAAKTPDPEALLEGLLDPLLEMFSQADTVGVLVEDERSGELQIKYHKARERSFTGGLRVPGTIITHVVQDRRGVLLGEAAATGGEVAGTRMGAPLSAQNAHYGVIYVEGSRAGFRQEDVDLLQMVAAQTALALHAAGRGPLQQAERDRLERDLRVARQIQRSLLPPAVPSVVGLDYAVHYEPAYQIGGDFYDFIWHDEGHLALAIGDVSGKAISGRALHGAAHVRAAQRAPASPAPRPGCCAGSTTEMVTLGDDGMFATLAYCDVRPRDAHPGVHQRRPLHAAPPPRRPGVPAARRPRPHPPDRGGARARGRRGPGPAALGRPAASSSPTASSRRGTSVATSTA
jgi:sigma-B regulation protein RsbU (phosphoserine phosphatase)